jgi:hypothetical protein
MWNLIPFTTPNTCIICPSKREKKRGWKHPNNLFKNTQRGKKKSCKN